MKTGLIAYRRLLELAERRQLSPPPESLMTTQRDIDAMIFNAGTPLRALDKYLHGRSRINLKPPVLGSKLPLAMRARKLMNQKATSVADLAFVLNVLRDPLNKLYEHEYNAAEDLREATLRRLTGLSYRARKRLRGIRAEQEAKALKTTQLLAKASHVTKGDVGLDKHTAQRLSMEFDGAVEGLKGRLSIDNMSELPTSAGQNYDLPAEVEILWADLRDGSFAKEWPEHVYHAGMQPLAFAKKAYSTIMQQRYVDADGTVVSEQRQKKIILGSSSQHVHGRARPRDYDTFREEANAENQQHREQRRLDVEKQAEIDKREKMLSLFSDLQKYNAQLETIEAIREKRAAGTELSVSEVVLLEKEGQIMQLEEKARALWTEADDEHYLDAGWARQAYFFDEMIKAIAQQDALLARSPKAEKSIAAETATDTATAENPHQRELDALQNADPVRFEAAREYLAAHRSLDNEARQRLRHDLVDRVDRPKPVMVSDRKRNGVWERVRGLWRN
jgi:hypothetical protein